MLVDSTFIEVYVMIAMFVTGFCIYDDRNTYRDTDFVAAIVVGVFWLPAIVIGLGAVLMDVIDI